MPSLISSTALRLSIPACTMAMFLPSDYFTSELTPLRGFDRQISKKKWLKLLISANCPFVTVTINWSNGILYYHQSKMPNFYAIGCAISTKKYLICKSVYRGSYEKRSIKRFFKNDDDVLAEHQLFSEVKFDSVRDIYLNPSTSWFD